jgi:hypothetical protein
MMKSPLQIMITRDAYKVAGMSTGTRWKSCIFLGTCPSYSLTDGDYGEHIPKEDDPRNKPGFDHPGSNAHRMNDILLSGTHAAYLISKGDHELKDPHARISLAPYHSEDVHKKVDEFYKKMGRLIYEPGKPVRDEWTWKDVKPAYTILRPSSTTYAPQTVKSASNDMLTHFESLVHHLTKTHFPMRHDEYHKDPRSYRDGGDPNIWGIHHDKPETWGHSILGRENVPDMR